MFLFSEVTVAITGSHYRFEKHSQSALGLLPEMITLPSGNNEAEE